MANIRYALVDEKSGLVTLRASVPARLYAEFDVPAGQRLVRPLDGKIPPHAVRLDLRKIRGVRNEVTSIESVLAARQPQAMSAAQMLDLRRAREIAELDLRYAARIDTLTGPLASVHSEKRRQAEAGGGPLVADEADRLAILENAALQDEAIAAVESERRRIKAAVKAATTEEEIEAALAITKEGFA